MASTASLYLLKDLIPGGIEYGCFLLVEFESDSIWYETSLTIAARALQEGMRTEYHSYVHIPEDVRRALAKLGLNIRKLQEDNLLKIIDSFTIQTGLGAPDTTKKPLGFLSRVSSESLKISDWSIGELQDMKKGFLEEEKRWLHVNDDNSVLLQYNEEKAVIDWLRTRDIPYTRARETLMFNVFAIGVASDAFYRQVELLHDGIFDFKSEESEGRVRQLVRVRKMRGKNIDSRWHELRLLDNGEVTLVD